MQERLQSEGMRHSGGTLAANELVRTGMHASVRLEPAECTAERRSWPTRNLPTAGLRAGTTAHVAPLRPSSAAAASQRRPSLRSKKNPTLDIEPMLEPEAIFWSGAVLMPTLLLPRSKRHLQRIGHTRLRRCMPFAANPTRLFCGWIGRTSSVMRRSSERRQSTLTRI